jgi:hypothetical protein
MSRTQTLFLLLGLIGPIHMIEQMIFGIDEFHMLRESLGSWYALFPAEAADHATVGLITIMGTVFTAMFVALSAGGRARLAVLGCFGVFGLTEVHHVIEALVRHAYDPGLVTSLGYVGLGAALFTSVVFEWRRDHMTVVPGRFAVA